MCRADGWSVRVGDGLVSNHILNQSLSRKSVCAILVIRHLDFKN